jgi:sugar phosphate permease
MCNGTGPAKKPAQSLTGEDMEFWDAVITVVIVGIAIFYLYKKFTKNKGCSSCEYYNPDKNSGMNNDQKDRKDE